MNKKKREIILLVSLIVLIIVLNYGWLDDALSNFLNTSEQVHVDRIIDGDTIESNSTSIRLLGINTPERGEYLYEEAKEFLEQEILNKTVNLKYGKERYDKYGRVLAYIFFNNQNINLLLVENGYANYYFPSGKDKYYNQFTKAWDDCIEKEINLCKLSTHVCSQCISININGITNNCNFECDIANWTIKAEGRNNIIFSDVLESSEEISFELELTETGDTLFLRDGAGCLVAWESY